MYPIRKRHHIIRWIFLIIGLLLAFNVCKVLIEYPHAVYKPAFESAKAPVNQNVSSAVTSATEARVDNMATNHSALQIQKWLSVPSNNQWLNNAKSNPNIKAGMYDATHNRINMKLYSSEDYRTGFIVSPLEDLQDARLKSLDAQNRLNDLRKHPTFLNKLTIVFAYHKIMKSSKGLNDGSHEIRNIWVNPEQQAYQKAKQNPNITKNTSKDRTIYIIK